MKNFFLLVAALLLMQCSPEKKQRPAHIINEDKLVAILVDVHVAEANIELHVHNPDTARAVFAREEKNILEKHAVEEPLFRESYQYYLTDLKALNSVYERVIDSLSMLEVKSQTK